MSEEDCTALRVRTTTLNKCVHELRIFEQLDRGRSDEKKLGTHTEIHAWKAHSPDYRFASFYFYSLCSVFVFDPLCAPSAESINRIIAGCDGARGI